MLGGKHADSKGQSSSLDTVQARIFDQTLFDALDALDERRVSYAVIGGVAASGLGRPRATQDIDIFVRPEDAEASLDVLASKGFRTEKTNPNWLFKAFKNDVLVDLVFQSQGGIYFDKEMQERASLVPYHGRMIRVVSPEDLVIIKVAVHSEEGPYHWHDALAVLSHAQVDWEYLIGRSRRASRRLLAFLIYVQSNDIWVPNQLIHRLFQQVFGDYGSVQPTPYASSETQEHAPSESGNGKDPVTVAANAHAQAAQTQLAYLPQRIREAIASDEDTGSMDIEVLAQDTQILLRGFVSSETHHQNIIHLVHNLAPEHEINDQIQVKNWGAPREAEELQ